MLKLSSLSPSSDLDKILFMWWKTLLWWRNWWSEGLNLRLQHLKEQSTRLLCYKTWRLYMNTLTTKRFLMIYQVKRKIWKASCGLILEKMYKLYLSAICWSELPLGSDIMRSEIVWRRRWKVWGSGWAASPAITMSDRGCSQTPRSLSCRWRCS